jgi:uncharacterized membrane protein
MKPFPVSRAKLTWLDREATGWRDAGLIDESTRARILESYEIAPLVRGTLLIIVLAVLTFAVGVLLLIGYNWHRIPAWDKVAIILASIAASFAASAVAYAKRRPFEGEALALLGVLLYGNGIWLIAQVLNIDGYFPDAFFWFAAGAGACAFLLRSKVIGIGTAILTVVWVFAAGAGSARPEFWFLVVWPAAVALAYRLRSPLALGIAAFAAPLWVFVTMVQVSWRPAFLGVAAVSGCALYAIGDWHRADNRMRPAWQVAGLLPLLLTLIPLLVTQVHREAAGPRDFPAILFAAIAVSGAVALTLLRRRPRDAATAAVIVATVALLTWTAVVAAGSLGSPVLPALAATIAFSALALLLAASLIRTALRTNDPYEFAFGVLFAVVFLIVRWSSVIHNMFLSGLIMISAGVALLLVARLWRHRDQAFSLRGRMS